MTIKPIKNEHDYNLALERLELILDAKMDTPEGDELEILSLLIEHYENEHYAIDLPDPIEAIKSKNGTNGFTTKGSCSVYWV